MAAGALPAVLGDPDDHPERPLTLGAQSAEADFQDVVAGLDYPMMVVTAVADDGERSGCLVGFATQCSIHPPRFAVWISRKNHTFGVAQRAGVLVVHFLSTADRGLAELFGGATDDEVDKFTRCRWRAGPEGVPVLEDCTRWFAGRVLEQIPTDDHVGFLLEPVAASGSSGPWPGQFGFQSAETISPGHEA